MGFVYFFRQKNTNYVKIGMTDSDSVKERFIAFSTYSPKGAEIVGTIESANALALESKIHKKLKPKRLNGEFFNLTEEDVQDLIEVFGSKDDLKSKIISEIHAINDIKLLEIALSKIKLMSQDGYLNKNKDIKINLKEILTEYCIKYNLSRIWFSIKDLKTEFQELTKYGSKFISQEAYEFCFKESQIRYFPLKEIKTRNPKESRVGTPYRFDLE